MGNSALFRFFENLRIVPRFIFLCDGHNSTQLPYRRKKEVYGLAVFAVFYCHCTHIFMLCFFRRKNTLFIFAEIVSRKIVSQHPFVARGVGCVDVQLLELHQHFVAVVVGTVSYCKDTKLLKAMGRASSSPRRLEASPPKRDPPGSQANSETVSAAVGRVEKKCTFAPSKNCGCGVMVAAPDLGSGGVSRGGSSPPIRTTIQLAVSS